MLWFIIGFGAFWSAIIAGWLWLIFTMPKPSHDLASRHIERMGCRYDRAARFH
jgi:hypothetical protein